MQREQGRLERAIGRAERFIRRLESQDDSRFRVHQKRRRLSSLRSRLAALVSDSSAGRTRLTFGSRKLWRGQYDLEGNRYGSHADWLREWRERRGDEFFLMGSRDEASGCQLCVRWRCRGREPGPSPPAAGLHDGRARQVPGD